MKKFVFAIGLVALVFTISSCGASRRGTGCPNSWENYRYRG